ncbi:hypothetical protein [Mycolicibacterium neoaurum]|uniref:hypothetical protein n=1 Tax=Mycolicibacterium neoaurum TaxID=1795 RepID=UPI001F4D0AAA|nr:hypothetical protein [Mycolicibacterium neoaurum]
MTWFDRYGPWRAAALLAALILGIVALLLLVDRPRFLARWPSAARVVGAVFAAVVAVALASYAVLAASPLERQWDGKLGWELPGCTTPDSVEVSALPREVRGPDDDVVGHLELRTVNKRECPPAIWARLLWNTPDGLYRIPPGWTLHMRAHRGDKVVDEPEPARDARVPYAVSRLLIAERDCVWVDAFFRDDRTGETTPAANTTCMTG